MMSMMPPIAAALSLIFDLAVSGEAPVIAPSRLVVALLCPIDCLVVFLFDPELQISCGSAFRLSLPLAVRAISLTNTIARGRL